MPHEINIFWVRQQRWLALGGIGIARPVGIVGRGLAAQLTFFRIGEQRLVPVFPSFITFIEREIRGLLGRAHKNRGMTSQILLQGGSTTFCRTEEIEVWFSFLGGPSCKEKIGTDYAWVA